MDPLDPLAPVDAENVADQQGNVADPQLEDAVMEVLLEFQVSN